MYICMYICMYISAWKKSTTAKWVPPWLRQAHKFRQLNCLFSTTHRLCSMCATNCEASTKHALGTSFHDLSCGTAFPAKPFLQKFLLGPMRTIQYLNDRIRPCILSVCCLWLWPSDEPASCGVCSDESVNNQDVYLTETTPWRTYTTKASNI